MWLGTMNFSPFAGLADKHLVGGKDHVFKVFHGINQLYLEPGVFQRAAQDVPLLLGFGAIDDLSRVGVLGLAHVEKSRGAHQDGLCHKAGHAER